MRGVPIGIVSGRARLRRRIFKDRGRERNPICGESDGAPDAQTTLLKTIEEPHPETYFVISLASDASLSLPLLSRLTVFKKSKQDEKAEISKFKLNLEDIGALAQNRDEAEEVFRKIEAWMEPKIRTLNTDSAMLFSGFVEDYFQIKKRFFERTYSPKMLLEHLALSKHYIE